MEARPAGLEVATFLPPRPTRGKNHCGRRRSDLLIASLSLRTSAAPMACGGPIMDNLFALVFTALVLLAGGAAVGMAVTVPAAASCEACGGVYAND